MEIDAKFQVEFLKNLQRILDEGSFVATYKFALLLALSDLAVEQAHDSDVELELPVSAIADKFLRYYWFHTSPFPTLKGRPSSQILWQNTGSNISLLRLIKTAQERGLSLPDAGRDPTWNRLRAKAARVVQQMPLFRLQTLRNNSRLEFLFDNKLHGERIVLKPRIASCFRNFHPLIQNLIQGAWIRHVRSNPKNAELLGEATELGQFLFGTSRATLSALRPALAAIQDGRCFYCDARIKDQGEVDHFVPWSKYPTDLGHNFVLADKRCNQGKSDLLAGTEHLRRWHLRNNAHEHDLSTAFDSVGLPYEMATSVNVTRWAYDLAENSHALLFVLPNQFEQIKSGWGTQRE